MGMRITVSRPSKFIGGYDAATNTPNLETPSAGTVLVGYTYKVTAAGNFFTEALEAGDELMAIVDNPSSLADWSIVQKNIVNSDDITQGVTNLFLTSAERTKLTNTSGTNSGDEVEEYANLAGFPVTGVVGVIYVAEDTNLLYRWDGAAYVQVGSNGGNETLAQTLVLGNSTGANDILVDSNQNVTWGAIASSSSDGTDFWLFRGGTVGLFGYLQLTAVSADVFFKTTGTTVEETQIKLDVLGNNKAIVTATELQLNNGTDLLLSNDSRIIYTVGANQGILDHLALTGTRTWSLPDASGTIALLSDIPAASVEVEEYANLASFPGTGTDGVIYVAEDTNRLYRWDGAAYTAIGGEFNTVDSVNTQTGAVVLDADDIDDATTAHKFVTATDVTNLSNLSGTNSGDEVEEYATFAGFPGTGATGIIYVDEATNTLYRWDGASYVQIGGDTGGGETLAQTLVLGNNSGANDIVMANNQKIDFGNSNGFVGGFDDDLYLVSALGGAGISIINGTSIVLGLSATNKLQVTNTGTEIYSVEGGLKHVFDNDHTIKTGALKIDTISGFNGEIIFGTTNFNQLNSPAANNYNWGLPAASGTLALTTDIPTDADDIDDTSTAHKFVTAGDLTTLSNTSGINSGDEVQATETVAGIAEIATQAEVNAGTDDTRMVTPLKLANYSGLVSKKSLSIMGSRDTNVNLDTDMRVDSVLTNTTPVIITPNQAGTYTVGIGAASGSADTWEAHVYKNGVSVASVAMTAQTKNQNTTASVVVAAGDEIRLRAVNVSGSVSRPRISTFWTEE